MTQPQKQLTDSRAEPLTSDELRAVRAVLNQDMFVRRFWASVRAWTLAAAAIIAALTVGIESMGKALTWIRGK